MSVSYDVKTGSLDTLLFTCNKFGDLHIIFSVIYISFSIDSINHRNYFIVIVSYRYQ